MMSLDRIIAPWMIGESNAIQQIRSLIARIAPTGLPVLIQGPTGVGKELVAEALHAASGRPGRFVAFNVCAIADTMFEDTLFGHVRGAFTGATADARGYMTEADHGTLFLDEIGGLDLKAQAKLLRAVETRSYRPVGGRSDQRSDFRVVSATNVPLGQLVESGAFRSDLAHRLTGITIEVPPLHQRQADIQLLAAHFANRAAPDRMVCISNGAISVLKRYEWPGNVRQLRQVIERSIALSDRTVLGRAEVELALRYEPQHLQADSNDFERRRFVEILDSCNWDTERAARRVGVHRSTIYRRMQRLGIAAPSSLGPTPSPVVLDRSMRGLER